MGAWGRPRYWALLLAAAILLWFGGYFWFVAALPVPPATPPRTDCIAVFTGRYERMAAGMSLLSQGRADRLFISGVVEGANKALLHRLRQSAPDYYDCCTDLGRSATNTAENAMETAAWARRRSCRSIALVTDDYHMPRSLLLLRRQLPARQVVPFPTPYYAGPEPSGALLRRTSMVEYAKYLMTLVFPRR